MNSVELFSGAGGLALGLELAGCRNKALVENNKHACSTLRTNATNSHPLTKKWNIIDSDVKSIEYENLGSSIHLVAGGPPCQPFSLGGKHHSHKDHRDLFPEAIRAVRELRPQVFLFENVKGLLRKSFSTYFNYIILQLSYPLISRRQDEPWLSHLSRLERHFTGSKEKDLSYRVVFRLLNAADYGVPQIRHRVFIVGFRSDLNREWSFPKPTHSLDKLLWEQWVKRTYWEKHEIPKHQRPEIPQRYIKRIERLKSDFHDFPPDGYSYKTVRDAISDLPDPRINDSDIPNHEFRDGARPYPGHTGSNLDEPSKTLKAGDHGVPGGENMMSFQDGSYRYYSVRESARIQTFPDDYVFSGSWTEAMRQIGNAVPVKLAHSVAESIHEQI